MLFTPLFLSSDVIQPLEDEEGASDGDEDGDEDD